MITQMKETYEQEVNRKIVKTLGYIPYWLSAWGRKEDEPGDAPATLNTICPRCFATLKIENKRESITYEKFDWGFTIEGNKWGYQKDKGKSLKLPYTTRYIPHREHLIFIDHNDKATACEFVVYEKIEG